MSGVTLLPDWPTSGDSEATFNTKADALGPALSTMVTQINTALGVTNISAWVSGAAYTAGSSVVWSPINFRAYRRKTTSSAGTTDPSIDTTNWAPVDALLVDASGNVLFTGATGGLGYGTGSGGTVTQATSKNTTVTLNKPTGQITMNNGSLSAGSFAGFWFNNSLINSNDGLFVWVQSGGSASNYNIWSGNNGGNGVGSIGIYVRNISAGALTDPLVIGYFIIKGVIA